MAKAAMGAAVMFCGHDGWFVADIFEIKGVNVVKANGPVKIDKLVRGHNDKATHHLMDFPVAGAWMQDRGVFVVPAAQVTEL